MRPLKIAVAGSGISGLSAAWALSQHHHVTLYEKQPRPGGHSNTVTVDIGGAAVAVDTGFIVYNSAAYPNLTALFQHLNAPTAPSDMSLAFSMQGGDYEYSGNGLFHLFGHIGSLFDAGHWRLLQDIVRFFLSASSSAKKLSDDMTLGEFILHKGYSKSFALRHLLPMAGAIWSAKPEDMLKYPARAFIRFYENHGLLKFANRPAWRTVEGGSKEYVKRLLAASSLDLRLGAGVTRIERGADSVTVRDASGGQAVYDHIVIAAHADEALELLAEPSEEERRVLSAFRYSKNRVVLHTDPALMPKRKRLWSSWNCMSADSSNFGVTYWMNRLQPLATRQDVFVSLNPPFEPRAETVLGEYFYEHPVYSPQALRAQGDLWPMQGQNNTWFCGAYFGAGFHEDGLQAGLAVAERLGGVQRPWHVSDPSGRMRLPEAREAA